MNSGRIVLTVVFWIIFSFAFDAVSGVLFPDISLDMWIWLWFFGLCACTILFNIGGTGSGSGGDTTRALPPEGGRAG